MNQRGTKLVVANAMASVWTSNGMRHWQCMHAHANWIRIYASEQHAKVSFVMLACTVQVMQTFLSPCQLQKTELHVFLTQNQHKHDLMFKSNPESDLRLKFRIL